MLRDWYDIAAHLVLRSQDAEAKFLHRWWKQDRGWISRDQWSCCDPLCFLIGDVVHQYGPIDTKSTISHYTSREQAVPRIALEESMHTPSQLSTFTEDDCIMNILQYEKLAVVGEELFRISIFG